MILITLDAGGDEMPRVMRALELACPDASSQVAEVITDVDPALLLDPPRVAYTLGRNDCVLEFGTVAERDLYIKAIEVARERLT